MKDFSKYLEGLDALLVTHPPNIRYLTEFPHPEGTWLLLFEQDYLLIGTPLYENDLKASGLPHRVAPRKAWPELIAELARGKLGFEADHTSHATYTELSEKVSAELVPTRGRIEHARKIKRPDEVERIKRAMAIAKEAYEKARPLVAPERSEAEIAGELERAMRVAGAEDRAFPPIVASGENGAFPHAVPTSRRLKEGELVTLDFGARYAGYHSDVTRTLALSPIPKELSRLLEAVKRALDAALSALAPGVLAKTLDEKARAVLAEAGLLEYFPHSLGHGVGLEVHEAPIINLQSNEVLRPGMVITLEPGVYVPGLGGARVEELVLVTEEGYEVLSAGL